MSTVINDIMSQALTLPAPARAYLAKRLLESLDAEPGAELSPAWKEEVLRRCREADEGLVESRMADEVYARAFAALE